MLRIIKCLVFTEKTTRLLEKSGQYVFDVDSILTKPRIRFLIEKRFSVRVFTINVHCIPRKKCRGRILSGFILTLKRVIVKLAGDDGISFSDF